jgi:hypothetical protein
MDRGHVSFRVVNVARINLDPLAFILHFLNLFWIASRLVCSFCDAIWDCTLTEDLPGTNTFSLSSIESMSVSYFGRYCRQCMCVVKPIRVVTINTFL